MREAIEPSRWIFPVLDDAPDDGPEIIGGDLEPGTLIEAYSKGFFPMPLRRRNIGWFSPNPRGVLIPDQVHVSRSLRRSMRHFEIRVDTAFDAVVEGCGDPRRRHGWINSDIRSAYGRLHEMGWAHSVEVFESGDLVGGLYGVSIGSLFAAESKFHRRTDASKAAVVAMCRILAGAPDAIIDVQWATDHLVTLGVTEVSRSEYLARLSRALRAEPPPEFA